MKGNNNGEIIRAIHRYIIFGLVLILILQSLIIITPIKADPPQLNSSVECSISFDPPILTEIQMNNTTFTQISMPECFSNAIPGDPSLPVYPVRLLIPYGKEIDDITVTYSTYNNINADLINKPIAPQQ